MAAGLRSAFLHALAALAAGAAILVAPVARATPAGDACTTVITSLPATITAPGRYCLGSDFRYSDPNAAVTIQSPDVTLDCRGFTIDGSPLPDDNGAYGIYGYPEASGLVVRRCTVQGFLFGMLLYGGGVVEDNVIRGPGAEGIYVEGDGSIVRRNRIVDLGNSTSGFQWAWGIVAFGDIDIVDNDIDGLIATPGGGQGVIGIVANDGHEPTQTYVIRGNRIRGLQPDTDQIAYAISSGTAGFLVLRDNILFGGDQPNSVGIYCWSTGLAHRDGNDLYDFAYPQFGCFPDGQDVIRD